MSQLSPTSRTEPPTPTVPASQGPEVCQGVSACIQCGRSLQNLPSDITHCPYCTHDLRVPAWTGKELIDTTKELFDKYTSLGWGLPLVLSLWTLGTYLFEGFDAFPYLAITSPTKRCGKTRLAESLSLVCRKPRSTVGISPAALFRIVESERPTLLIDEVESLRGKSERAEALREILNAGYRRGQKVIRCSKENFAPEEYETYGPKALILIGNLPDTLADRCIHVKMHRRTKPLARFRYSERDKELETFRQQAARWATEHKDGMLRWYQQNDLSFLEDREAELWLPLFAVCTIGCPDYLADLEAVAKKLSEAKALEEPTDLGVKLLTDMRLVFDGKDKLPTKEILSALNAMEESPWPTWYGKGLNSRGLSLLLRPFGVEPRVVRLENGTARGYVTDDLKDAWSSYLDVFAVTSVTTRINIDDNTEKGIRNSAKQDVTSVTLGYDDLELDDGDLREPGFKV